MTPQQEYLLTLIKEIDAICKRHGIVYWLAGGSLIGAVRHGGFLPWDDDADLYMTREMWERFAKACETELPPGRILQSPELDPSYTNTFPRYTSVDYVTVHAHQSLDTEFVGEVIDIFVLEPVKNDPDVFAAYTHDLMVYSDILNYSGVFGRRFGTGAADFAKWKALEFVRGKKWVRAEFEQRLASYLDDESDILVMRWGGNPFVFDRAWFAESQPIMFEDMQAWAPCGVDQYLTFQYGYEWYQVPSVTEAACHEVAASMLVKPEDAYALCSQLKHRFLKLQLGLRKVYMLHRAPKSYAKLDERLELEASIIAADVEAAYALGGVDATEALDRYIAWQNDARIAGRIDWKGVYRYNHPVVARVSAEFFEVAVLRAFNTERTSKAERMVEMRTGAGLSVTVGTQLVAGAIVRLRQARIELQAGRYAEAARLAQEVGAEFQDCLSAKKVSLAALRALDAGSERFDVLAQAALEQFPDDGDFLFFAAEAAAAYGDVARARELYARVPDATCNGLVLQELARAVDAADAGTLQKVEAYRAGKRPVSAKSGYTASEQRLADAYLELFGVVVDACEALGLRYIVGPLMALYLQHQDEHGSAPPLSHTAYELFLPPADVRRLVDALEADPSLLPIWCAFEYPGNSPRHPWFNLRFYDERTTDLSLKRDYEHEHRGISITVTPLRARKRSRVTRARQRIWRYTCLLKKSRVPHAEAFCLARPPLRPATRKAQGRRLFDRVLAEDSAERIMWRLEAAGCVLEVPVLACEDVKRFSLCGREVRVPADIESYTAGIEAQEKLPKLFAPSNRRISSAYAAYATTAVSALDGSYYQRQHRVSVLDLFCTGVRKRFVRNYGFEKDLVAFLDLYERQGEFFAADGGLLEGLDEEQLIELAETMDKINKTFEKNPDLVLSPEQRIFYERVRKILGAWAALFSWGAFPASTPEK